MQKLLNFNDGRTCDSVTDFFDSVFGDLEAAQDKPAPDLFSLRALSTINAMDAQFHEDLQELTAISSALRSDPDLAPYAHACAPPPPLPDFLRIPPEVLDAAVSSYLDAKLCYKSSQGIGSDREMTGIRRVLRAVARLIQRGHRIAADADAVRGVRARMAGLEGESRRALELVFEDVLFAEHRWEASRLYHRARARDALALVRVELTRFPRHSRDVARFATLCALELAPFPAAADERRVAAEAALFAQPRSEYVSGAMLRSVAEHINQAAELPLEPLVRAGMWFLPKISAVLEAVGPDGRAAIPHPFVLPDCFTFHSQIVCPVMKEVVGEADTVRLGCGHVISQMALDKLRERGNMKCPYCPVRVKADEVLQLRFWA
eukprot:gnl/Chilomastix_cuspidata/4783.p2 GENE.gnl/Chilomastix_cuspidata/4783~~gnl/Chilomastix_cuspidata/4783.p2  ORF type:complete len:377 (-),score=192.45 gnl/Chilomastix_cuspidata/4783:93-1223(-)